MSEGVREFWLHCINEVWKMKCGDRLRDLCHHVVDGGHVIIGFGETCQMPAKVELHVSCGNISTVTEVIHKPVDFPTTVTPLYFKTDWNCCSSSNLSRLSFTPSSTHDRDQSQAIISRLNAYLSAPLLSRSSASMADKAGDTSGFAPVFSALATMQSNVSAKEKSNAHEFLEKFQKSVSLTWIHKNVKR